jgi:hypothetical protein
VPHSNANFNIRRRTRRELLTELTCSFCDSRFAAKAAIFSVVISSSLQSASGLKSLMARRLGRYQSNHVFGEDFSNVACAPQDLRVWILANEGLMSAHRRAAHQHNVLCYLSAGMGKGWALVTLFGGISYLVEVTTAYSEPTSRQFSIFYDAATKERVIPVVLANEMTLIGHVLSPATKFENREAVYEQWHPIISAFCAQKGVTVERLGDSNAGT